MNSMDYDKVLPPHSYLYADDSVDPKKLMKKLEEISKDAVEYESYFWWKRHYIVKKYPTYRNVPCQLCDILNNPKYVSKNNYSNFHEFWFRCLPTKNMMFVKNINATRSINQKTTHFEWSNPSEIGDIF